MPKSKNIVQIKIPKIELETKAPKLEALKIPKEPLTKEQKADKKLAENQLKYFLTVGREAETKKRSGITAVLPFLKEDSAWNVVWWQTPFTILTRPLQAVLQFTEGARTGEDPFVRMVEGALGLSADLEPTDALGIDTSAWNGVGKFFANLGLAVALDPLTWLTLGGAALTRLSGVPKLMKTAEALKQAMLGEELLGGALRTAKRFGGIKKFKAMGKGLGLSGTDDLGRISATLNQGVFNASESLYKAGRFVGSLEWKYIKGASGIWIPKRVWKNIIKPLGKWASTVKATNPVILSTLRFFGARVSGVSQAARNIAAKMQFGFATDTPTKEILTSIAQEQQQFMSQVAQTGKVFREITEARTHIIYAGLQGKAADPKYLKMFNKIKFTEDIAQFRKAGLSADSTFDEILDVVNRQVVDKLAVEHQAFQRGYQISHSFDANGSLLVADRNQALKITDWLNKGKSSPLRLRGGQGIYAEIRPIADVKDVIALRKTLGRPITDAEAIEMLAQIQKSTKGGAFISLRRVAKGKQWDAWAKKTTKQLKEQGLSKAEIKIEMTKVRKEFGNYLEYSRGDKTNVFAQWEEMMENGQMSLVADEHFREMMKVSGVSKQRIMQAQRAWQKTQTKHVLESMDTILKDPRVAAFVQEGVSAPLQSTLARMEGKLGKGANKLFAGIKKDLADLDDLMVKFMQGKTTSLSKFYDFSVKLNDGYRKAITDLIENPVIKQLYGKTDEATRFALKKEFQHLLVDLNKDLPFKAYSEIQRKRWLNFYKDYLTREIKLTKGKGFAKVDKVLDYPKEVAKRWKLDNNYRLISLRLLNDLVDRVALDNPTKVFKTLSNRIAREIKDWPTPVKDAMVKTFKEGRAAVMKTIKETSKQAEAMWVARQKITELIRKGMNPEDMRATITNVFIKRLNGKFTKEQVAMVLDSFKKQMPQEMYDNVFRNVSLKGKTLINEKVAKLVNEEKLLNQIAYEAGNALQNRALMRDMMVHLPKETLTKFKFKDLHKMESLELMNKFYNNTVEETMNYLETFANVPAYYRHKGYFPLHVNDEYGLTLAGLTKVSKDIPNAKIGNPNLWLPNLSERQIGKIPNSQTYITMRRPYLDNASYVNSILGFELFNNETPMFYAQLYKNSTPFFFKPVLGTFAFEAGMLKLPTLEELTKYNIGDILPDGFRVVTRKDAANLITPLENSLLRDGGIINAKWKATINQGSDVYENLPSYYQALNRDITRLKRSKKWAKLNPETRQSLEFLQTKPLIHNRTTQGINTALQKVSIDADAMKFLKNSGWIKDLEFEQYTLETVSALKKNILSQSQDKMLVHNSVWDVLNTKMFEAKEIQKTYGFLSKGFALFTGFWKGAVLWRNFGGYHLRNILGNYTNAVVGGVDPVYYASRIFVNTQRMIKYNKMVKVAFGKKSIANFMNITSDTAYIRATRKILKKGGYSADDIKLFEKITRLKRTGVMGNSRIKAETYTLFNKMNERLELGQILKRSKGGKMFDTFGKVWGLNAQWNMFMDDAHRLTIHQYFTENTGKLKNLGYLTVDDASRFIGFDFHQLTSFEKKYMQRLFPFYTWFRKNFEFHLKNFPKNTSRYRYIYRMLEGWNRDIGGLKDNEILDWQKERNYLVDPTNTKRLIKLEIPFLNYDEIFGGRIFGANVISKINPFMKTMIETATGRNFFYDRSIDADETTQHVVDSLLQISTAKKRWSQWWQLLTGETNNEVDKMVALAPSIFSKIDKESNRVRNKWQQIEKLQNTLRGLQRGGTYVPRLPEIRSLQNRQDKLKFSNQS